MKKSLSAILFLGSFAVFYTGDLLPSPLPPPPNPAAVYFLPGIGQSNTRGDGGRCGAGSGNPIWVCSVSNTSPNGDSNLMESRDSNFYPTVSPVQNLKEYLLYGNSGVTDDYETPQTGLVNQLTYMASLVGRSVTGMGGNYATTGQGYSAWGKGGSGTNCCYAKMLTGTTEAATLINALPAMPFFPLHWSIAGESDFGSHVSAATWETNMVAEQSNYQTDRTTNTGQSGLAPLFLTQSDTWSSWPSACNAPTTDCTRNGPKAVPFGLNLLLRDHYSDGTITFVGPTYQYTYVSNPHMIPNQRSTKVETGYREAGAKIGEAIWSVLTGHGWKPVAPRSITVSGATVSIQYFTASQLVLDSSWLMDRTDCGFEVIDSGSGTTAIAGSGHTCSGNTNVVIVGTDTVQLTLNQAPVGTLDVLYAYTPVSNLMPGGAPGQSNNGAWGNLRDSDATRCWCNSSGTQTVFMYNPGIMFRESAPFSLSLTEPTNLGTIPGAIDLTANSSIVGGRSTISGAIVH